MSGTSAIFLLQKIQVKNKFHILGDSYNFSCLKQSSVDDYTIKYFLGKASIFISFIFYLRMFRLSSCSGHLGKLKRTFRLLQEMPARHLLSLEKSFLKYYFLQVLCRRRWNSGVRFTVQSFQFRLSFRHRAIEFSCQSASRYHDRFSLTARNPRG